MTKLRRYFIRGSYFNKFIYLSTDHESILFLPGEQEVSLNAFRLRAGSWKTFKNIAHLAR